MRVLVEQFINPHYEKLGASPVIWLQSQRKGSVSAEDYGKLSEADRLARMAKRQPSFTSADIEKLQGKKVIIFDDLIATGSYERNQTELLKSIGVKESDIVRLYWLQIDPEIARRDPSFEAEINYVSVKSLDDLLKFFYDPDLVINARTLKYILSVSSNEGQIIESKKRDLEKFLSALGEPNDLAKESTGRKTLQKLYSAAFSEDAYYSLPRFAAGCQLLDSYIQSLN
jgi:hypothetical protein